MEDELKDAPAKRTVKMASQTRAATFLPASVDAEKRTATLVWTTGAIVDRYDWDIGEYREELVVSDEAVDLSRLNSGAPLLNSHRSRDLADIVGVVEKAWIENGEGKAEVRFSERPEVDAIFNDVKSGIIRNISVGYSVKRFELIEQKGQVPLLRAVEWLPAEISLVAIGADAGAGVRSQEAEKTECELIVRAVSPKNNISKVKKMEDEIEVKAPVAQPAVDLEAVRTAERAAERARALDIRKAVRSVGLTDEVADDLVERGIDLGAARIEILEKVAQNQASTQVRGARVSVGYSSEEPEVKRSAMAEALAARAMNKRTISDQAKPFGGMGFVALAREITGQRNADPSLVIRAALTTVEFPLVLAEAANKVLAEELENAQPTYKLLSREIVFPNFMGVKSAGLGAFPAMQPKATEAGEYAEGVIGERGETVFAEDLGSIAVLTRKVMINDDLNAFASIGTAAGQQAQMDMNDYFFSKTVLANPVLSDGVATWHATHGNLGVAGDLSIVSIGNGRTAMRKQVSFDGRKLQIVPTILLVGPELQTDAEKLVGAIFASEAGNFNPFSGRLTVVCDANIEDDSWMLLADARRSGLVHGFVNGQGPRFETKTVFESDNLKFKLAVDFGVGVEDHRGTYKVPGSV